MFISRRRLRDMQEDINHLAAETKDLRKINGLLRDQLDALANHQGLQIQTRPIFRDHEIKIIGIEETPLGGAGLMGIGQTSKEVTPRKTLQLRRKK